MVTVSVSSSKMLNITFLCPLSENSLAVVHGNVYLRSLCVLIMYGT